MAGRRGCTTAPYGATAINTRSGNEPTDNCPRLRLSEVTLQVVQAGSMLVGKHQSPMAARGQAKATPIIKGIAHGPS